MTTSSGKAMGMFVSYLLMLIALLEASALTRITNARFFGSRASCQNPLSSTHLLTTKYDEEMVYYTGEGEWDEAFIIAKQNSVPAVQIVDAMPEPLDHPLHNRYYLLRHGQSTANVAEVISSDRFALAYSTKHGLTSLGYRQGMESATQLLDCIHQDHCTGTHPSILRQQRVVFVSSPFARARQTAKACLDGLQELSDRVRSLQLDVHESIVLNDLLVERSFGRLDNEAIYTYSYVWPLDKFNVTHTAFDVESVAAVCTRLRQLIVRLELEYSSRPNDDCPALMHHFVLVSHADVLQIAQLYAAQATNVGEFSSFRFKNGEVREMLCDSSAIPDPLPLEKPNRSTRQG